MRPAACCKFLPPKPLDRRPMTTADLHHVDGRDPIRATSPRNGGRNHLGTASEIKSDWWATSFRIRGRLPPEAAFIAVLVVFVLLLGAAMFTQGNLNPGEREDRGNGWVIWAITGLSLALAYVPAYTDRIGFWALDGEAVRWIG